jgi:tetratricopeptide (TPR) repeat protein
LYCTRCGTKNPKSSRYCRECGKRLVVEALELEVEEERPLAGPVDGAAVAELLDNTLRLYERGRLDAAFASCKQALRMSPNTPSGHSLLGLIYEKKAEEEAGRGNREDAEDYLHAAIRQFERVLDANPNSDADRGKLEELRATLDGQTAVQVMKRPSAADRAIAALGRVPLPWAAAAGASVVVFIILALALRGAGEKPAVPREPPQAQAAQPSLPPAPQPSAPANQAPVYQPAQPSTVFPPSVYQPETTPSYQPPSARVVPPASPFLFEKTERPSQASPAAGRPAKVKPPAPAPAAQAPLAEQARAAHARGDFESAAALYEQAIAQGDDTADNEEKAGMCLYNLGRKDPAIAHFQRALQLYTDQKAKGTSVEAAASGIDRCRLYIDDLTKR